jgi:putative heme iron utilization protein
MSKPSLTIAPRSAYGVMRAFPVDANAKLFAKLCGQASLTAEQLKTIKALGFDVIQQVEGMKL